MIWIFPEKKDASGKVVRQEARLVMKELRECVESQAQFHATWTIVSIGIEGE